MPIHDWWEYIRRLWKETEVVKTSDWGTELVYGKAFLSLDLMCTHEVMKGEGDSHLYTWSTSQINHEYQWTVRHIAFSPKLGRCWRNAAFWWRAGSLSISMWHHASLVQKVRIRLPQGQVYFLEKALYIEWHCIYGKAKNILNVIKLPEVEGNTVRSLMGKLMMKNKTILKYWEN